MSRIVLKDKYYHLSIRPQKTSTSIQMQMITPITTTHYLPHTFGLLSTFLPSIHTSRCFNDKRLPFSQEVKNTEIGHLFEHILLEYIYELKVFYKQADSIISGETSWNWHIDPHGLFHINVSLGATDKKIFFAALTKSITLLNKIIEQQNGKVSLDY